MRRWNFIATKRGWEGRRRTLPPLGSLFFLQPPSFARSFQFCLKQSRTYVHRPELLMWAPSLSLCVYIGALQVFNYNAHLSSSSSKQLANELWVYMGAPKESSSSSHVQLSASLPLPVYSFPHNISPTEDMYVYCTLYNILFSVWCPCLLKVISSLTTISPNPGPPVLFDPGSSLKEYSRRTSRHCRLFWLYVKRVFSF